MWSIPGPNHVRLSVFPSIFAVSLIASGIAFAQQPAEPVDISPSNGEIYYLIHQSTGLQLDVSGGASNQIPIEQSRSFTALSQRWAFSRDRFGDWQIRNQQTGSCLAGFPGHGGSTVTLQPCRPMAQQLWKLEPVSDGYYALCNAVTHELLDLNRSREAGEGRESGPQQSQLWLLRPAYLRGIDNALLEKQEGLRVSQNIPWWKDDGQPQDVLAMMRDHGINTVRIRPSSAPPYDPSVDGCTGNACYAETEVQDLDLAKRARNLGMSVELSLLFDGGSSASIPPAWTNDTLEQAENDVYRYVKSEIEEYRKAGVLPDLVAIGNEVDTGFLGSLGSPTGAQFSNFAALQKAGIQAVHDAASDPTIGNPLPSPLTCIHITPAWNLVSFFTLANQNGIVYDAICQSYYPIYHGPLTDQQAQAANPNGKPVEQDVLNAAATTLGKPIFIIETGEHYESGFQANDPWYSPTVAGQEQFLLDLQQTMHAMPNNLAMGVEYWDPAGVNILAYGGPYYFNAGYPPDSIYVWNGLTLFNNGDSSGVSLPTDPNYSELLSSIDAVGNKLDPTMQYKFVSDDGRRLLLLERSPGTGALRLTTGENSNQVPANERWTFQSEGGVLFQVISEHVLPSGVVALAQEGSTTTVETETSGNTSEIWNVKSVSHGDFQFLNPASGSIATVDGISKWKIVPVP